MRAVAYLRMSSEKQATSIRDQRVAVHDFAERNGHELVGEYVDEAISGDATERRVAFQKMIADAGRGGFRAIIVWDLSRLGRFDMLEAGFWLLPLRNAGVAVITLDRGLIDWNDFAGRITWGVEQEGKHAYLRDLSRNVLRGQVASAKQGRWMSGRPPFGYALQDARLIPGPPDKVAILRRIFAECIAGFTLRGIADRLNSDDIPSTHGLPWTGTSVKTILDNRAFLGEYRWGRKPIGKYSKASESITILDNHPPLIDAVTFEAAQRALKARTKRTAPVRNGGHYILTGLIRCGVCGSKMFGSTENEGKTVNYACGRSRKSGRHGCVSTRAKQHQVVECVLDCLAEKWATEETLDRFRKIVRGKLTNPEVQKKDVAEFRREMISVERKMEQAERRLVEVDIDLLPVVQKQIRELQSRKVQLAESLRLASGPRKSVAAEVESKVREAERLFRNIREASSLAGPMAMREFLNEVVESVSVWVIREEHGQRTFHVLDHGIVKISQNAADKLFATTGRSKQVPKRIELRFCARRTKRKK